MSWDYPYGDYTDDDIPWVGIITCSYRNTKTQRQGYKCRCLSQWGFGYEFRCTGQDFRKMDESFAKYIKMFFSYTDDVYGSPRKYPKPRRKRGS